MKFATLVLGLMTMFFPAVTLALHSTLPEKFPAWYNGEERTILMGPAGNSADPNQLEFACFRLGPQLSNRAASESAPVLYALFLGEENTNQMYCLDEDTGERTWFHDMVLTSVPGEDDYSPVVLVEACIPGPDYAGGRYTSEAAVLEALEDEEIVCQDFMVMFGMVVD